MRKRELYLQFTHIFGFWVLPSDVLFLEFINFLCFGVILVYKKECLYGYPAQNCFYFANSLSKAAFYYIIYIRECQKK